MEDLKEGIQKVRYALETRSFQDGELVRELVNLAGIVEGLLGRLERLDRSVAAIGRHPALE